MSRSNIHSIATMNDHPAQRHHQQRSVDTLARVLSLTGCAAVAVVFALFRWTPQMAQAPNDAVGVHADITAAAQPETSLDWDFEPQGAQAARIREMEGRLNGFAETLRQLVKTMDVTANPEEPDYIQSKPASEGRYEVHYAVVPLAAEAQEIIEVRTKAGEGGWENVSDWEMRDRKLFLLTGYYEVQEDSSTVRRSILERRQFRITYR